MPGTGASSNFRRSSDCEITRVAADQRGFYRETYISTEHLDFSPGTWDSKLREHFKAFTDHCWIGFNSSFEDMREKWDENKATKMDWRQCVLWDMQDRHDREKREECVAKNGNKNDDAGNEK